MVAAIAPDEIFVLLDDARGTGGGPARLFRGALDEVVARTPDEVAPALARLRAAGRRGLHAAGWIGYEAGLALDPATRPLLDARPPAGPLLWFGLFAAAETVAADKVPALLPDPAGAVLGAPRPLIGEAEHAGQVAAVQRLIAAGDIYQANLTFPAEVAVAGDLRAAYARLRAAGGGGHGALVRGGGRWLLSFSPELFFRLDAGRLTARPMKGTAARDPDDAADARAAAALLADPKQRAENLMIVDLLRNDLARVAAPGSVAVPRLFTVESYPTVHQLTSTVTAALAPGRDAVDVLGALFPCGSITGAPKIRAIQVIDAIEGHARHVYTGSIGHLAPNGDATFSIAIRTLEVGDGRPGMARLGLGSGIVADSAPAAEWRECLAKGAFVNAGAARFDLVETMRFDAIEGIQLLDRHLARMKRSADALGFAFDRHEARNNLQAATFRLRRAARVRLRLARGGQVAIEVRPLPPAPDAPVAVALARLPVPATDVRLRHKTSDRGFYDEARRAAGCFEVAFTDAQGFLTEGSFTSLFVARGGVLLTPPAARGLLPGVLRQCLIEEGRAEEADLRRDDLARGFYVGNAVRGLVPARLAGNA